MGNVAGTVTGLVQPLGESVQLPAVRLRRSCKIQIVPVPGVHQSVPRPGPMRAR